MTREDLSRRRFLVAAMTATGLASAGIGGTMLATPFSWVRAAEGDAEQLARIARLLFPHDKLTDAVYVEVIDSVITSAAGDASLASMLDQATTALNSFVQGNWLDAGELRQIAAMQSIQDETFFAAILDNVRFRFYNHAKVWQHIGYPGSSVEFGGYIDRGFDDIDWLPEES
ncbi:MAG: hypothetical protein R3192_02870 [Woeseiaceae bacterium]|nr:hypothetical protein [Woeseiaceae bacterium]